MGFQLEEFLWGFGASLLKLLSFSVYVSTSATNTRPGTLKGTLKNPQKERLNGALKRSPRNPQTEPLNGTLKTSRGTLEGPFRV